MSRNNFTQEYPPEFLAIWSGCTHKDCLPACWHRRRLEGGHCARLEIAYANFNAARGSGMIGKWLSAALEDPAACEEMKADIRAWFDAGEPSRNAELMKALEGAERRVIEHTMMKLWLLRPVSGTTPPWKPWYDKAFGFVIGAESESEARLLASKESGDEGPEAWTDPILSSCIEIKEPQRGIIIRDFAAA